MRFYLDKDDSVNLRRKRIETSLSTGFEKGILSSHYTVVIEHKAFFFCSLYTSSVPHLLISLIYFSENVQGFALP